MEKRTKSLTHITIDDSMIQRVSQYDEALAGDIAKIRKGYIIRHKREHECKNDDTNGVTIFFIGCPHCGFSEFGKIHIVYQNPEELVKRREKWNRVGCLSCGETDPFQKIDDSLYKAQLLLKLALSNPHTDINKMNERTDANGDKFYLVDIDELRYHSRTLLEQSTVLCATGLEVFLKDYYSVILNVRYVKNGANLIDYFSQECKNDFVNFGKIKHRLKRDLAIDINKIIDDEAKENIALVLSRRNAIVHNGGNADEVFIKNTKLRCKKGKSIPLSAGDVEQGISSIKKLVDELWNAVQEELFLFQLDNIRNRVDSYLPEAEELCSAEICKSSMSICSGNESLEKG